jgi:hypothetical protein
MKTVKLARFPKIKHLQGTEPCCIPASIENVVRYHGGDVSQQDIRAWCTERYGDADDIDLDKARQVMEETYGDGFSYHIKNRRNSSAISSEKDMLAAIQEAIDLDIPVIVQMNFPSCLYLPSYSTTSEQYVLTVLGASENHVLVWDTNPGVLALPVVVSREWMTDHMASGCTSLWIIPEGKENEVEALFTA